MNDGAPVNQQEIILAQQKHIFPSVFHYFKEPLVLTKAKDQYVWDANGNQYLDFFGGIVTVSVGHCNDEVNKKVKEQMDTLEHVSTAYITAPQVKLAQRIAGLTPGNGALSKFYFTNSGTEANETAFLTARLYTGSTEIVALRHGYHGRSATAMAATGVGTWRLGGAPTAGFTHAINAYCYLCPLGLKYPSCNVQCAKDMVEHIRTATSGKIAAFIAEPIQGVGGFITPPKEYFEIVHGIVKKFGGLFISDEVQTGWGRTGKWWGIDHYGVVPDMITAAKGVGNGLPIGITAARPEVADAYKGLTISTFGGNPVTTTAALAVIDYIDENKLMINAAEMGVYLRGKLDEMQTKFPLIGEVRGMGLLQAIELVEDRESKTPAAAATNALLEAARENRVLIGKGGLHGNVLRISPPMNINKSDVDSFVERLSASFAKVTADRMAGAAR
ncbi:MAG: aspartate aminotransferase family protein [Acidobacteriota bacterium]